MKYKFVSTWCGHFRLTFLLGYKCNYHCEYCCQNSRKENNEKCDEEMINFLKDTIQEVKKHNRRISVGILGGEPSCYPMNDIINAIDDECIYEYRIITNLSMPVDFYLNWKENNPKVRLLASLHETQTTLDEFFEKVEEINKAGINIHLTTVLTNDNGDIMREYLRRAEKIGVHATLNPEKDEHGDVLLRPENNILSEYKLDMNNSSFGIREDDTKVYREKVVTDKAIFKGYLCSVRQDNLRIFPNGKVVLGGSCKGKWAELGNFRRGYKYKYLNAPVICKREKPCGLCGSFVISNDAKLYNEMRSFGLKAFKEKYL